jgi:hypothetical protein
MPFADIEVDSWIPEQRRTVNYGLADTPDGKKPPSPKTPTLRLSSFEERSEIGSNRTTKFDDDDICH